MNWNVYLSGEIHTDWRDQIEAGARKRGLPITFTSACTIMKPAMPLVMYWVNRMTASGGTTSQPK